MPLTAIGAGFGRTGTMSLKAAFEILGIGPCYHMVECLPRGPKHWKLWTDAANGTPDWDTIFDGYASTTDFPASTYAPQLAAYAPDAKVVLTHRDPERWFQATQETIFAPHWIEYQRTAEMGAFLIPTINDYFNDRMHDRDHLIQRYHEHTETIRAAIPADRLLEFEVKDGWEPLCAFLDRTVPDEPFPAINDAQATKDIINRIIAEGAEVVFGYNG